MICTPKLYFCSGHAYIRRLWVNTVIFLWHTLLDNLVNVEEKRLNMLAVPTLAGGSFPICPVESVYFLSQSEAVVPPITLPALLYSSKTFFLNTFVPFQVCNYINIILHAD